MATVTIEVSLENESPADTADLAWEIAQLFPAQGDWSEDDFLNFTDELNQLVEFQEGRIEVLEMPTLKHQRILQVLFMAIHGFVTPRRLGTVITSPFRVKLGEKHIREPDLVFKLATNIDPAEDRFWTGADLVVEVVSKGKTSRTRDLVTKRELYAKAGIAEYWIADSESEKLTVLTLGPSGVYEERGVFGKGQVMTSTLLKGLTIEVSAIFADSD